MTMRNLIRAAALATAMLSGLAAAPASAQGRHDRGGHDGGYGYNQSSFRYDRYDRGHSYRRDRDDRGRHRHRHWNWRDR